MSTNKGYSFNLICREKLERARAEQWLGHCEVWVKGFKEILDIITTHKLTAPHPDTEIGMSQNEFNAVAMRSNKKEHQDFIYAKFRVIGLYCPLYAMWGDNDHGVGPTFPWNKTGGSFAAFIVNGDTGLHCAKARNSRNYLAHRFLHSNPNATIDSWDNDDIPVFDFIRILCESVLEGMVPIRDKLKAALDDTKSWVPDKASLKSSDQNVPEYAKDSALVEHLDYKGPYPPEGIPAWEEPESTKNPKTMPDSTWD